VVLFEMATGGRPCYGPDENSNPATAADDVTLRLDMFESTITAGMVEFFGSALSRHATARPDTVEDMLRAWRAVFTTLEETDHSDDIAAEKADTTTALAAAGLTARAVSALAAVQVTTVGELVALDSTRLNRLVAREAKDTRKEITARQVLSDFGGVAAIDTLTAEIRARLPEAAVPSPGLYHQARADRAAGGLLRVALERLSEHETASGTKEFVRRRHGNCLALLATDELLLAAADSAA
jgi:hypothetical protein